MIDTHCHLTYDGLRDRLGDVLAGAAAAGVDRMITIGTSPDDAARAIDVSRRHAGVFAAVGLHPHHAAEWRDAAALVSRLRELAASHPIVALGEMGLDRHYPDPPLDAQVRVLEAQLDLAKELPQLPIIIHNREATEETLAVLHASGINGDRFVFHCFTGSAAELDAILSVGAYVGFTGIVTFKSARALAEASDRVPLERLFIETDAPYLTPEPHRKVKTNEPMYVAEVARFLAARRGMSVEAFAQAVDANAERFFRLSTHPGGADGTGTAA